MVGSYGRALRAERRAEKALQRQPISDGPMRHPVPIPLVPDVSDFRAMPGHSRSSYRRSEFPKGARFFEQTVRVTTSPSKITPPFEWPVGGKIHKARGTVTARMSTAYASAMALKEGGYEGGVRHGLLRSAGGVVRPCGGSHRSWQWLDRFSRRDPMRETVELAGACQAGDGGPSPIRPLYLMSLFSGCGDNRDKRDKRDKRLQRIMRLVAGPCQGPSSDFGGLFAAWESPDCLVPEL